MQENKVAIFHINKKFIWIIIVHRKNNVVHGEMITFDIK